MLHPGKTKERNFEDTFQAVLEAFFHSPDFQNLELGVLQSWKPVHQFSRTFSIQKVYALKGSRRSTRIFVKIYKNAYGKSDEQFEKAIVQDFETNLFWYHKLHEYPEFSTIKPLFLSLPHRAVITEEARGENLGELVLHELKLFPGKEKLKRLLTYMRQTGRLLRLIQHFETEKSAYDLHDLVEDVDSRMRELVACPGNGFAPSLRQNILDFYNRHMPTAATRPLHICYLHRDFMMGNLLVHGNQLIIHDFSRMHIGPGLLDLTRFFHHLELLKYKPIYRNRAVTALQRAFLQGYGGNITPEDILFRFFLIRHYITHFKGLAFSSQEPLKSRMYNRYVMAKHLQNLRRIIQT